MISAQRKIFTLCLSAIALAIPLHSSAQTDVDRCSQDVMMSYYPEVFVAETLEKFNVPKEQRSAIIRGLEEKDREVIPTIEEKASRMNPNPLQDPQKRQEAVKLFRDTLLEMFASVMQANGINDKDQIQKMLDDVQMQKAKQFAACMEQQERRGGPPQGAPNGFEDTPPPPRPAY